MTQCLTRDDLVEEKFFESYDGTKIAYYVTGKGAPLILSNGLGGTYKAWYHLILYFKERFRIYSWDYRGIHHSGTPPNRKHLRMEDHVKDALLLCEREKIEKAIWAGWSMGVQLNLEIYRHAPNLFRALILINGTYERAFDAVFEWRGSSLLLPAGASLASQLSLPVSLAGRTIVKWNGFTKLLKKMGLVGPTMDEGLFSELAMDFSCLDVKNYMAIIKTLGEHSAKDVLPKVAVPVLIIAGEKDHFTPKRIAEEMCKSIPGAQICIIPGGTHYAPLECPEAVNTRIEEFMREKGLLLCAGAVDDGLERSQQVN